MISINRYRVIGVAILCALIVFTAQTTFAQEANRPVQAGVQKDQETNLDLQLYLVLASNRDVEDEIGRAHV